MPNYAFFNGQFVPFKEAKVGVMTHAFNYGTGCFEGIRAYWNQKDEQLYAFRLREHFERLHRSCGILRIQLPHNPVELGEITVELLRKEGFRQDAYVRPLAYKVDEIIGVRLHDLTDGFTMFAVPFGRYIEKEEGAHVCVSAWRRVDDNAAPARAKITGAYINSALVKTDAILGGYDEALTLTQSGHISEGSAENFFMLRDGCLITPPVTSNILEGITRDTIIELAEEEMGLQTIERPIDRSEVYVCQEAFFVGTGVQVAAITQVEHRPVGTGQLGPVVARLREIYFDVVRGNTPKYRHWCTPVYG
jgi:branched-chain amino acid aminotransferase